MLAQLTRLKFNESKRFGDKQSLQRVFQEGLDEVATMKYFHEIRRASASNLVVLASRRGEILLQLKEDIESTKSHPLCKNCFNAVNQSDNFCPNCGQSLRLYK
jgi:hypothetical protein